MKKIILSAAILFALAGSTQAQLSAGNLFNKAKDKAKQKAEEKKRQEAEKATTKNQKNEENKETETKETENSKATNTTTTPTTMNDAAYNEALQEKYLIFNDGMDGVGGIRSLESYSSRATQLDLARFYSIMQKKGKPADKDAATYYQNIMKMRSEYPAAYEQTFKPDINEMLEKAYATKKYNKLEAVKLLKDAQTLNDACLMIIPDMQNALSLKADLSKAITDIGGDQSKVLSSDFHKKNAGKILFSKEPIIAGKENPTQFTTSFGPQDRIYAMAYLNGSIQELTNTSNNGVAQGRYILKIDGNDQFTNTLEFNHNKEDYKIACFPIEVRPDPAKAVHGLDATYFAERFGDLSPRKHTVGISFTAPNNYDDAYAYGEIKLDWSDSDAEKMKADAKLAVGKAQDNYSKTVQLNPAFSKSNYLFQDPALSPANLKKAFLAAMPDAVQILKMVTIKEGNRTDDWQINRNDYGVIVGKVTNHYTSFVYKAKNGNCYMHFVSQFGRVATGGGGYGTLTMYPTGMIDERIACENVK